MSHFKAKIMIDIFGTKDINTDTIKQKIISNFYDYDSKFTELESIYNYADCEDVKNDIIDCHIEFLKVFNQIVSDVVSKFVQKYYEKSIDYVLMNREQQEIEARLEHFLNSESYPELFKSEVYRYIKALAERLDKRFSFDELALVNLIEASCGKNIYTEQGGSMNISTGDDKYVVKEKEEYVFKKTKDIITGENGKKYYVKNKSTCSNDKILDPIGTTRLEKNKIYLESFPLGSDIKANSSNIMNKLISNLFENLELCIETYNTIYSYKNNVIDNVAYLPNGDIFNFSFTINDINIPHLLGIPRLNKGELSKESIGILNSIKHSDYPLLSEKSNGLDLLKFIRVHRKEIISLGGLYESNGKKYEILNWEKIILKTSSFMRGDFFKMCFCLAKIAPNKYLVSPQHKGGYASITSTEYAKGINTSKTAYSVLNDLLKTTRQHKDFIFRGFVSDGGRYYVNSIMTGKSESIRVGKNNELIKTLQRYRNLFYIDSDSNGGAGFDMSPNCPNGSGTSGFSDNNCGFDGFPGDGSNGPNTPGISYDSYNDDLLISSIVETVVNEHYIKQFTPEEQAQAAISISRDLGLTPEISRDALDVMQQVHDSNNAITLEELDKFSKNLGNGHTR